MFTALTGLRNETSAKVHLAACFETRATSEEDREPLTVLSSALLGK